MNKEEKDQQGLQEQATQAVYMEEDSSDGEENGSQTEFADMKSIAVSDASEKGDLSSVSEDLSEESEDEGEEEKGEKEKGKPDEDSESEIESKKARLRKRRGLSFIPVQ